MIRNNVLTPRAATPSRVIPTTGLYTTQAIPMVTVVKTIAAMMAKMKIAKPTPVASNHPIRGNQLIA